MAKALLVVGGTWFSWTLYVFRVGLDLGIVNLRIILVCALAWRELRSSDFKIVLLEAGKSGQKWDSGSENLRNLIV